jgi:hypothetical protein
MFASSGKKLTFHKDSGKGRKEVGGRHHGNYHPLGCSKLTVG